MEFNDYVRVPFVVEAVEVTTENIAEIAPHVGTLQHKADGTPFIQVDKSKVPNVYRVYPGFYMTRMGDNVRCYARRVFNEQFVRMTPEIQEAVDTISPPKPRVNPRRTDPVTGLSQLAGQTVDPVAT